MKLYIVSTPIGNLKDITQRAIDTINNCPIILCEDTRNTMRLLNALKIEYKTKKLISYHKFNEKEITEYIFVNFLDSNIALVTDSGTPAISDPGAILVNKARENNIEVIPICGASAVIAAMSASGIIDNNFTFVGFLNRDKIKTDIQKMLNSDFNTFIIYESPQRILKTLTEILKQTSSQNIKATISLFNDLTKLHERCFYGNLEVVITELEVFENINKGEYVFVINFQKPKICDNINQISLESLLVDEVVKNNITIKEAIANLTKKGLNKNELYKAGLNLKNIGAKEHANEF